MATGASSPAVATSMAALSSRALVPKAASTVGTDTPAAAATALIVVPAYPAARNCPVAAAQIRARVRRALLLAARRPVRPPPMAWCRHN